MQDYQPVDQVVAEKNAEPHEKRFSFNVAIPAHNEETSICSVLDCLTRAVDAPLFRHWNLQSVTVYDDESGDATQDVVHRYADKHPDLPLVVYRDGQRRGKSGIVQLAMCHVAPHANATVFLDADIIFSTFASKEAGIFHSLCGLTGFLIAA